MTAKVNLQPILTIPIFNSHKLVIESSAIKSVLKAYLLKPLLLKRKSIIFGPCPLQITAVSGKAICFLEWAQQKILCSNKIIFSPKPIKTRTPIIKFLLMKLRTVSLHLRTVSSAKIYKIKITFIKISKPKFLHFCSRKCKNKIKTPNLNKMSKAWKKKSKHQEN